MHTDRLETLSKRFDEIEAALANPSGGFDQARYAALMRERANVEETVAAYRAYKALLAEIASNETLAADRSEPELAKMAEDELAALVPRRKELEERLTELMLPRD